MIEKETKLDFHDLLIRPKVFSEIRSRYNEISPYVQHNEDLLTLPLMTAPMSSVVCEKNMFDYIDNNFIVVLPRTIKWENLKYDGDGEVFYSYSISEFRNFFATNFKPQTYPTHVLIDVANGHMKQILDLVIEVKNNLPDLTIMVGNVANPKTYKKYAESGVVDFVRIGIGNGNGCLTTQQTGVGYPMASLIKECYYEKKELINSYIHYNKKDKIRTVPAIVADGGMKDYSDIIKALGLGADYVMMGSILNKSLESSGDNYLYNKKISRKLAKRLFAMGFPVKKQYYGMSTKIAQKKLGASKLKTSEGVVRYRNIEYTLASWRDNFVSYFLSAMSYSDCRNPIEFIGKADFIKISDNALNRFKK